MVKEYFDLWFYLSDAWRRAYDLYKITGDAKVLKYCEELTEAGDIVRAYQFRK